MPPAREPYLDFAQGDERFPTKSFDPKAVTRASWEPAPRKPKPKGPLVSLNRHPDAQAPMAYRTGNYKVMSRQTKKWIVWIRRVQLGFRVVEFNAALGVLALMILITKVDELTSWLLRILSGVSAAHCFYGIYHLTRPAGGRTPSSSAAYQFFAGFCDLCILPIYGYGAVCAQRDGAAWSTLLDDESLIKTLAPTLHYILVANSGLHAVTLLVSLWLGIMFRKITQMPPDMNPLESHLTARSRHKKAKSSTSTAYTEYYGDSTTQDSSRTSVQTYDEVPRGPAVPFHHTRARSSISSSNRDSRLDLPSRHYQLAPGTSPRNSTYSLASQRDSFGTSRPSNGGSYVGLPLDEPGLDDLQATGSPHSTTKPRGGKFTENWTTSQSLISRTQHRNKAMAAQERDRADPSYEAITERYGYGDSDSEADGNENVLAGSDFEHDVAGRSIHPNPLGSNPATPRPITHFFSPNVVSERSLDKRNASGSFDIADQMPAAARGGPEFPAPRNRDSSIQPEAAFYSKPYGELKAATPPIMVGADRQVSSGNDYDVKISSAFARRNVSGKIVEEGRAGQSYGR